MFLTFKKLFLGVAILSAMLSSSFCSAQSIQLSDLFKPFTLSEDKIDEFILRKNFFFSQSTNLPFGITMNWYKENNQKRYLTLDYYESNLLLDIEYTTLSQEEYLKLKNQINLRGYQLISSKSEDYRKTILYGNVNNSYQIEASQLRDTKENVSYFMIKIISVNRQEKSTKDYVSKHPLKSN